MPGTKIGNRNSLKHGRRCLSLGRGPRGSGYVQRLCYAMRRQLETAVVDAKGMVDLVDDATIQTAMRWERHALLTQRWLRREADSLTPDQRLSFSRDIATASANRDKCIKALGLNRSAKERLTDLLYRPNVAQANLASVEAAE